ncbi:hypothetical protein Glove_71g16 [Diversispora epigaea]|uniref:Uncharacterized protein n=1 Tax=Diversispora epigaea TaxID=1348612 RepID=A0A397JGU4_9GLOM|nr:hypothetical protein Glove_71g16 [Diversispora epigaea]
MDTLEDTKEIAKGRFGTINSGTEFVKNCSIKKVDNNFAGPNEEFLNEINIYSCNGLRSKITFHISKLIIRHPMNYETYHEAIYKDFQNLRMMKILKKNLKNLQNLLIQNMDINTMLKLMINELEFEELSESKSSY